MRDLPVRLVERCFALSGLTQDALLYLASAIFGAAMAFGHGLSDYKAWGEIAGVAYLCAAAICAAAAISNRRRALPPPRVSLLRRGVLVALVLGAVIAPLCAELAWRAEAKPGVHAQPEVAVIERAGDRVASGQNPYPKDPNTVGVAPSSDQSATDASAFFPYLPGMVSFGVLNALHIPPELRDARVALALFTLVVGLAALCASRTNWARRGRILQFLVVLPSGALPMVTGGDDLPVLALMLLALVLAQRRNPILAGLVLGLAGSMKPTAWALAFLLAFAVRDRNGERAVVRYLAAVSVMVVPAVVIGLVLQPTAFLDNVVRFPLGLARIKSPAASPLLGQFLVSELPAHKTVLTVVLVLLGAAIAIAALRRYPPRTPVAAAGATAFVMTLATVLAPATRFGYLIYPANLIVWAIVLPHTKVGEPSALAARARRHLDAATAAVLGVVQSPSSLSRTLSSTTLAGPLTPGVDELSGSTNTPTSQ